MKLINTLITILFISLLSSPSWSQTWDDLVWRDGLYYEMFSDVPFTGKITGLEQGSFENGKKEGAWVWYYSSDRLRKKANYKNDKYEGAFVSYWPYYGQLSSKGNWKNGQREGTWVDYNEDGTIDTVWSGTYKNGKRISD